MFGIDNTLACIVEAALLASAKPLTLDQLLLLFSEEAMPTKGELHETLVALQAHYADRGIILQEVASGWRFVVSTHVAPWISKLFEEKPQRYSRALLETLAIIAYRQPITRSEIESIRGVVVSSQMVRSLLDQEWIRVVGYKEVPGKPALYATTKVFLDHFNLKSLEALPPLADLQALGMLQDAPTIPAAFAESEIILTAPLTMEPVLVEASEEEGLDAELASIELLTEDIESN